MEYGLDRSAPMVRGSVAMAQGERHRLMPRKVDRQSRSVETRRRVLASARHEFAARGYLGCTTNHIARHASMSIGSLYQYYPNKDAILAALMLEHIDDGVEVIEQAISEAAARDADLEQTVYAVIRAFVELHGHDRRLHQVLFEMAPRLPVVVDRLHEVQQQLIEGAAALIAAQRPDVEDPVLAAETAIVMIEALVHHHCATERHLDVDGLARYLAALVIESIGRTAPS